MAAGHSQPVPRSGTPAGARGQGTRRKGASGWEGGGIRRIGVSGGVDFPLPPKKQVFEFNEFDELMSCHIPTPKLKCSSLLTL